MEAHFLNVSAAYSQCESLNTLASSNGEKLIKNLESDINNLKVHWVGTDATKHINHLISVYNALIELVYQAKRSSSEAASMGVIKVQTAIHSNCGEGSVGEELPSNRPDAASIATLEDTNEFYCEPASKSDYTLLVQICTDFDNFISQFTSAKDELMNNWISGANRENAVEEFNDFASNSDLYKNYLIEARDNLEIAVNNLATLY